MTLKNIIIICSALFSHFANGQTTKRKKNQPGQYDKIPEFPEICGIPEKENPYKEKGGLRKLQASQYRWRDSAFCVIDQPGRLYILTFL